MGLIKFSASDRDIAVNKAWMERSQARKAEEAEAARLAKEAEDLAKAAADEAKAAAATSKEKKEEKPAKKSKAKKSSSKKSSAKKSSKEDTPPKDEPNLGQSLSEDEPNLGQSDSDSGEESVWPASNASSSVMRHFAEEDGGVVSSVFNSAAFANTGVPSALEALGIVSPKHRTLSGKVPSANPSSGLIGKGAVDEARRVLGEAKSKPGAQPIYAMTGEHAGIMYKAAQEAYDNTVKEYELTQGLTNSAVETGLISRDLVETGDSAEDLFRAATDYLEHLKGAGSGFGGSSTQIPSSPVAAKAKRDAAQKIIEIASSPRVGALHDAYMTYMKLNPPGPIPVSNKEGMGVGTEATPIDREKQSPITITKAEAEERDSKLRVALKTIGLTPESLHNESAARDAAEAWYDASVNERILQDEYVDVEMKADFARTLLKSLGVDEAPEDTPLEVLIQEAQSQLQTAKEDALSRVWIATITPALRGN